MEVWKIIEEQKRTELFAQKERGGGVIKSVVGEIDIGEAKRLQRGSVGSDRGG